MSEIKCVSCEPTDVQAQFGLDACEECYVNELMDKVDDLSTKLRESELNLKAEKLVAKRWKEDTRMWTAIAMGDEEDLPAYLRKRAEKLF